MDLIERLANVITIESGILATAQAVSGLIRTVSTLRKKWRLKHLTSQIDNRTVAGDLERCAEAVDAYIWRKRQEGIEAVVLSETERKQFHECFYKAHPEYHTYRKDVDRWMDMYLDTAQRLMFSMMTEGEKFTGRTAGQILDICEKNWTGIEAIREKQEEGMALVREELALSQETAQSI